MSDPDIIVTEVIDEEAAAVIGGGLDSFNDRSVGYSDRQSLAVLIKDPETGEVLGGATGRSSLGLLFLDLLYLPESLRGSGLGTRILKRFEEEGQKRGCRSAVVYTISFQAPKFYVRNGWRVFGEIPCAPIHPS
ncbi:GNAT family N-acetyltransferase [Cupriavidus sp. 8B]